MQGVVSRESKRFWRTELSSALGPTWSAAVLVALPLAAVALWVWSVRGLSLDHMADTGLISVMPILSFVAIGMLLVSFGLALRRQPVSTPIMLLHVVALIFMLYGLTALVEDQPRFAVTWLHAGFVDYVQRTGEIDPGLDARFSWPGFFILGAFVTRVAGLENLLSILNWIPVFFNLLYLAPLVAIFRSMTEDARLVWLGVWVFFLT